VDMGKLFLHFRCRRLLLHLITLNTHTHTHSAVLLWTRDRPVAETYTWQHTTLTRHKHPCPPAVFEASTPAS